MVQLFYFDEVKYNPPAQNQFWMGGIGAPFENLPDLENAVNGLAEAFFGNSEPVKETEFHGVDILQGNGNFRGVPIDERLDVFRNLLEIIHASAFVRKVYIRINAGQLIYTADSPEQIAFMFFVERANAFFQNADRMGMLIGDYDQPAVVRSISELSRYRRSGTGWRGGEINNIVDTVHFAQSHHSRMVQLADVYLYTMMVFLKPHNDKYPRIKLKEMMREMPQIHRNTKTTEWPNAYF